MPGMGGGGVGGRTAASLLEEARQLHQRCPSTPPIPSPQLTDVALHQLLDEGRQPTDKGRQLTDVALHQLLPLPKHCMFPPGTSNTWP
jgi:hypothetical protein